MSGPSEGTWTGLEEGAPAACDAFEQIQAVMDLLPVGLMLVAGDSVSSAKSGPCNATYASIIGATPAIGTSWSELPYAYYRSDRSRPLPESDWPAARAIATGETVQERALHLRRADGEWRVVNATAAPLKRGGRVRGAVVVYQDVTAQHELENALRESEDGTYRWHLTRAIPVKDSDGRLLAWFGTTTDIDQQKRAEEALRESEARYARLAATVPGVLYEYARRPDGSGRFSYLSPRCSEVFEVDSQDILDDMDVFWKMVHPEDLQPLEKASLVASRSRTPFSAEVRITTPSGQQKWIQLTSLPCPTAPGEPATCSGFILDITERKRTEEALRESEEWLKLTVEATGAGTINAVPYGPATISPRSREMLGIPEDYAMEGFEAFLRLVHPDDRDEVRKTHERALDPSGDGHFDNPFRCVRPDGSVRWIAGKAKAQFAEVDGARRATRFAAAILDITERKREEEALRESEARGRAILASLAEGVVFHGADGMASTANEAALELLGLSIEELTGRSALPLGWGTVRPDGSPFPSEEWPVNRALRTGQRQRDVEMGIRRPDDSLVWLSVNAQPMRIDGKVTGVVVSLFDITQRKHAEEALRNADRRKNEFLAMLSHELRNPLAALRNGLFILEHAASGGEQARRALGVIDRQVSHLARLVDDLLDVSRISQGKIQLQKACHDLADLARRSVEDSRSVFVANGVELRTDIPGEPLWVNGDGTRLAQVIGNLLQNAAKFTLRGGQVTLTLDAEVPSGTARIRVRDTGPGIDPALRERLFQPFEQADTTLDRSQGGLGLGLALVKGLVELHAGTVEVLSDGPGKGAEFVVRIPLEPAPVAVQHRQVCSRATRPLRILVIEDNEDTASTLREVLEFIEHEAEVAHSGPEGLEMARSLRPDAVICDIGLPGMSGYDVARAVRADRGLPQPTLIALSGYASPEDIRQATEAGFEHHLAKPLAPDELARLLAGVSQARAVLTGWSTGRQEGPSA